MLKNWFPHVNPTLNQMDDNVVAKKQKVDFFFCVCDWLIFKMTFYLLEHKDRWDDC